MGFLMPKMPKMQTTPPMPSPDDEASEEGRRRELARQAKAGGRSSTIMTDYMLATTPAPIYRQTLGGQP